MISVKNCNCCSSQSLVELYRGSTASSLTTMNTTLHGPTVVSYCSTCGHVQTDPLIDLKSYYEETYEVGRLNENDDQLYAMDGDQPVYRAEHQARIACQLLAIDETTRILDYGCGKSLTMMRITEKLPALQPFLYDVSDKYLPIWTTFTSSDHCFVRSIPASARGSFDIVTSFYALEHISDLSEALTSIRDCLKPGGTFYFLVPNVLVNVADFIVADHVNHFLPSSLQALLLSNGFIDVEVSDSLHFAAFVVTAKKAGPVDGNALAPSVQSQNGLPYQVDEGEKRELQDISSFWASQEQRLVARLGSLPPHACLGIYGAGFYGSYLRGLLQATGRTAVVIVDQNPFLQGTLVDGLPVVAPMQLPEDVDTLLVGLNPKSAKGIIQSIDAWQDRDLDCIYLE
jgi:SAM-dependent methyltransferase